MNQTLAILIQLLGLILLGAGLAVEIVLKAHLGYILLTGGSIVFAVGTKLRHERRSKGEG